MGYTSSQNSLMAAVGKALADWSAVEMQLCSLFQKLADIPDLDKARALFDGILSFEIRLNVLDRLMTFEKVDPIEAEMWLRMSARLSKFYKKRHELAHFSLAANEPARIAPFLTLNKWTLGKATTLNEAQVSERDTKFIDLVQTMDWFIGRALARRGGTRENPSPSDAEHPLVAQIRELAIQCLEEKQRPRPPSQV